MFRYFKALRRLTDLEEAFEILQKKHKILELEWAEAYDKLRHMMGRVAKRAASGEQPTPIQPEEPGGSPFTPNEQLALSRLPPRQRQIQEQILLRRKVNGGS